MSAQALQGAAIPGPVREVVEALRRAGFQAFLVGGCVRDLLLGKVPKDWDVATSAVPTEVQQAFRRVIPTGIEHGTVTVVHRGAHVEVTTFRSEAEYVDGRRPSSVRFHTDIEADLSRRDFTMNAMAFDPSSGELVDPFRGQEDLRAGLVRCVRSADERFAEDGLRALRAVRFATVLGFEIEVGTLAAIPKTIDVFRKVAMERVKEEFQKLLLSPRATQGLTLLERSALLGAFFEEAVGTDFAACGRAPADLSVRLAVLASRCAAPKDVVLRLKFPTAVATLVAQLRTAPAMPPPGSSDVEVRRWLATVTIPVSEPALALGLAEARLSEELALRIRAIAAQQPPLTAKDLALKGQDVMRLLGVGPSPVVGEATRFLLALVIDDPTLNTQDVLAERLRAKFSTGSPHAAG